MKENNLEQLLRNGLDYRLKTGEYFHFHQSDDNYYDYTLYNKYGEEIDGGMLDFGEDKESQSLMQIRERLADFTGIDELKNPGLKYIPEIDYEDEDLYDKIEEENYMEKNETNDLWYEQITSLNKKDLIDFCKYYKDFVLKENFEEEER